MDSYSELESKKILVVVGTGLQLAARLAEIRNDIAPVVEARKAIPNQLKDAFGMPETQKFPATNHCQKCKKVISKNKIRCLTCQAGWLLQQQKESK